MTAPKLSLTLSPNLSLILKLKLLLMHTGFDAQRRRYAKLKLFTVLSVLSL